MYCSWCDFSEEEPDDCTCEEDCGEKDCSGGIEVDDESALESVQ